MSTVVTILRGLSTTIPTLKIGQFHYAKDTGDITVGTGTINIPITGVITHTGDATGNTALTVVGINNTILSSLSTGILKNTTATGVPSIAVAGDFPTLNQNTTGSAASLSAILVSTYGGTGNGFTKFTGPTTAERTFTLPDSDATLLTSEGGILTGAINLGENAGLEYDINLSADEKFSGMFITGIAGEDLDSGELCALNDGDEEWYRAEADESEGSIGDCRGILGIVTEDVSSSNTFTLMLHGFARSSKFPTLDVNEIYYVYTIEGEISNYPPSGSGYVIKKIGIGLTSEILYFNPTCEYTEVP